MKNMMRQADSDTLLLIDEFGGGTEPAIGGAIAEAVLKQFWKKKANWDKKLRAFAAKELLTLANDWASSNNEHPGKVWTKESFADALQNESITMQTDGSFEMWYDDGGIFFGHAVVVYGDIQNGAAKAKMEG
jgi:hypothetical protein